MYNYTVKFNVGAVVWLMALVFSFGASIAPSVAVQDQSILQAAEPVATVKPTVPMANRVFGDQLFSGNFKEQPFVGFNPDYEIAVGDQVSIKLWGGFDFAESLIVDMQGNIFLPNVGPVAIAGVKNQDLNGIILGAVKSVYKKNVGVYASLNGAEPVKVFVTGFVDNPGLYAGHASDSILYFLDSAGGVDANRGSYKDIQLIRSGKPVRGFDLYEFLLKGTMQQMQLRDGDTILVGPVGSQVHVVGDVYNANRFEFAGSTSMSAVLAMAQPKPEATHVRIERNGRRDAEVEYLELTKAMDIILEHGDRVSLTSDKRPGTIAVRVEGEHDSAQEYILPYGASMQDLISKVNFGRHSEVDSLQLMRKSVQVRQKEMLQAQLRALESSVLTAKSRTESEARLRAAEAELILKWLERAKNVEPRGQVTLAGLGSYDDILLEPGDVVRVPRKSSLIMIHGDVLFPNAVIYKKGQSVEDYIDQAGGFTQSKSAVNILILHRDGSFLKLKQSQFNSKKIPIKPGDENFVLPRVQTKSFQLAKDIIEVFYQLALSAGVVLRL